MNRACLLLALSACASDPEPIEYTGETRRFVVSSIRVPTSHSESREFGLDIDGDRTIDNQLGAVTATLANLAQLISTHGDDMIAAGAIASSVELVADDFLRDDTVALRYIGIDGEPVELIGGVIIDGRFETRHAGEATIHVPGFVDADPMILRLHHARASLVPDGTGGYIATIGGAIDAREAVAAAFDGADQMLRTRPRDHVLFFRFLDTSPQDFTITEDEFATNSVVKALLSPDITKPRPMLSIGFRVHLRACAQGTCATEPATSSCFDRVKNGDETDVDCGGSCGACAGGFSCAIANDCESHACESGRCALPSCNNGVRDGFETDVDCGTQCGPCATGQVCWSHGDCVSKQCGAPCSGTLCGNLSLDRCY
jgi:hypothetical protein